MVEHGAANPWIYLPLAVLLGALHALEPGHSKSMMAAFIVAVRGTPAQAALLGLTAAAGHTLIVWIIALAGLYLGDKMILDKAEPWLVLISGLLIMGLSLRIFALMRGGLEPSAAQLRTPDHAHQAGPNHDHHKSDEDHNHDHSHEPHVQDAGLDAHAAAHARHLQCRFGGGREVTNLDIAWFGFSGGLLPCPAAIAVLLICLQLKAFTLGIAMVAAFSAGLAIALIAVGLAAVWGAGYARSRWQGFDRWSHRLPYVSASIVFLIGFVISVRGVLALMSAAHAAPF
ncbi:nickel/cobalt efflux transporter [Hyphomicrobium sp. DMF-1]|uniref:nickel/cobalt efflux transporter n=1 Tax=Hyphomicrobium sp. DMF-1 TaxID=3019544 RepID=UPI0022EBC62A|nr:nickel/cobalt efflux transporter [Hyphomicrobium sp. DMF-1]WBT40455.1 nickel/cobalt efflux transporter [Hyphomicrobium sp. DMF-1]